MLISLSFEMTGCNFSTLSFMMWVSKRLQSSTPAWVSLAPLRTHCGQRSNFCLHRSMAQKKKKKLCEPTGHKILLVVQMKETVCGLHQNTQFLPQLEGSINGLFGLVFSQSCNNDWTDSPSHYWHPLRALVWNHYVQLLLSKIFFYKKLYN